MKLISNGFEYHVTTDNATLYYGFELHPLARKANSDKFRLRVGESNLNQSIARFEEGTDVYYAFFPLEGLTEKVVVNLTNDRGFRREFVKWRLYETLKEKFFIDLNSYGLDLVLYTKTERVKKSVWSVFKTYNVIIRDREIHVSIGSKDTLILDTPTNELSYNDAPIFKGICEENVCKKERLIGLKKPFLAIASQEVRIQENLVGTPEKPNYPSYYKEILALYNQIISWDYVDLTLMRDGFVRLRPNRDYFSVARSYSVMLFKNGRTNVNPHHGVRQDGVYAPPPFDLKNLEFIFIYPNSEKAKALFLALRNGMGTSYPGLERYVGVPIRKPEQGLILKYNYDQFADLPEMIDAHIRKLRDTMPDKVFFALVLLPKGKKDVESTDMGYYRLKEVLISNDIASQFVDERVIETEPFVYFLPNISIAIQAKLGGIPWRLERPEEEELIVGFGDASSGDNRFVGSTVFFDNGGRLRASGFYKSDNIEGFKQVLRSAILEFIQSTSKKPSRLVIHYFKLPGHKERNAVYDAIKMMGIDIPFAIVTINEAKAKDFIAFDEQTENSMPMSGIVWKVRGGEYILFNNSRYEEFPRTGKAVKQEYPIKLRIEFSDKHRFDDEREKELIGQVFEFSRLYWKSVNQQSKPVTVIYPELIAEHGQAFSGATIPDNHLTRTTPWFI